LLGVHLGESATDDERAGAGGQRLVAEWVTVDTWAPAAASSSIVSA